MCFPGLISASNETTKIILPSQTIQLQDLNPQITRIDDAFFLICDAIRNSNSDKISSLLNSPEIKKTLTYQDVLQDKTDPARTGQANTYKREKLRKLLDLAIENQISSQSIKQLLEFFVKNKKLSPQDKFELYKDAKTIYISAQKVLEFIKKAYDQIFEIPNKNLPEEYAEKLENTLNSNLLDYVEKLRILVSAFASQKYSEICHEYQNFDLTIWKLYQEAKNLDYKFFTFFHWNTISPDAFVKAIGQSVESEFSFDKIFSDFVDGATKWIARGLLGSGIAGIIFLSWYFGSATSAS